MILVKAEKSIHLIDVSIFSILEGMFSVFIEMLLLSTFTLIEIQIVVVL